MPSITLTQSKGNISLGTGWYVLDTGNTINIQNDAIPDLASPGVIITGIKISASVRNFGSTVKHLQWGFKPSLSSGRTTWEKAADGENINDYAFQAIKGSSGGAIYAKVARTYSPSSNAHVFGLFNKYIRDKFAKGEPLIFGAIQPKPSRELSVYVKGYFKITIDYDFLGNVPTTDVSSAVIGSTAIKTNIEKVVDGSTTTLRYKIGNQLLAEKAGIAGVSDTYTPPLSAGAMFPNSQTAALTVEAETFVDTVSYGVVSTSVTLQLPPSAAPTCTAALTRTWPSSVAAENRINAYVQNITGVSIALTGSAKYGASVAAYSVQIDGSSYGASPAVHPVIKTSGDVSYSFTVTDSRGLSTTYRDKLSVLPWSPPSINAFLIDRVTEDGNPAIDGTYARAAVRIQAAKMPVGAAESNAITYLVQYREIAAAGVSEAEWVSTDSKTVKNTNRVDEVFILTKDGAPVGGGGADSSGKILPFNDLAGYEFKLIASDIFGSNSALDEMPTKDQLWDADITNGKMGFGGDAPKPEESAGYRFHKPVDFKQSPTVNGEAIGMWQPGDSITLTSRSFFAGYISAGSSNLYIGIPLGKPLSPAIRSATVTGNIVARGVKGYVGDMSYSEGINVNASPYRTSIHIEDGASGNISLILVKSSAFSNVTNNTPIAVNPASAAPITITFSDQEAISTMMMWEDEEGGF